MPIVVALLGGGAMGAIITAIVGSVRSRRQPIKYTVDMVPVFQGGMLSDSDVVATLSMFSEKGGSGIQIPNLFIAEVEVTNGGNKDLASFQMGVTLSKGDVAAHCAIVTSDRHHQANVLTPIGPAAPKGEIDFALVPFNRKDTYKFRLYVINSLSNNPGDITPSSPEPVIFQKTSDTSVTLANAAVLLLENIQPFVGKRR
jgi:hypothetical protein